MGNRTSQNDGKDWSAIDARFRARHSQPDTADEPIDLHSSQISPGHVDVKEEWSGLLHTSPGDLLMLHGIAPESAIGQVAAEFIEKIQADFKMQIAKCPDLLPHLSQVGARSIGGILKAATRELKQQ